MRTKNSIVGHARLKGDLGLDGMDGVTIYQYPDGSLSARFYSDWGKSVTISLSAPKRDPQTWRGKSRVNVEC